MPFKTRVQKPNAVIVEPARPPAPVHRPVAPIVQPGKRSDPAPGAVTIHQQTISTPVAVKPRPVVAPITSMSTAIHNPPTAPVNVSGAAGVLGQVVKHFVRPGAINGISARSQKTQRP